MMTLRVRPRWIGWDRVALLYSHKGPVGGSLKRVSLSSRPLVSVVIPTWERGHLVGRAILSALAQTYQELEVIVVDNASSDDTAIVVNRIARRDERVRFFVNPHHIGAVQNWRRAFELSKGSFIKFLWSDDFMEPNTIESLLEPMLGDEAVGFTICPAVVESPDGQLKEGDFSRVPAITWWSLLSSFVGGHPWLPVSPAAALIRREAVEVGFNLRFASAECETMAIGRDLLLLYAALVLGYRGVKVTDTFVHFWAGDDSITMTSDKVMLSKCYGSALVTLLQNGVENKTLDRQTLAARLRAILGVRCSAAKLLRLRRSFSADMLQEYAAELPRAKMAKLLHGYLWASANICARAKKELRVLRRTDGGRRVGGGYGLRR